MTEIKRSKTLRSSIGMMTMIMISRMLGLVRTLAIAYYFGASAMTDAFYSAFSLSNALRQLLGEGALGTAFIPIFNEKLEKDGEEEAKKLIFLTLNFLFVFLLIVSALMIIFSHVITDVIVFGYPESTKILAGNMLKIMAFYLFFVGLSGMIGAVLNNYQKFLLPAATSILFNLSTIVAMMFFSKRFGIESLAWGVLVAGFLQLIVVVPSLLKITQGYKLLFSLKDKYMKKIFKLVLPRLAGVFSMNLNLAVDQFFGSFLIVGSISALNNASYIYGLPLGMFGVALGTVIFPTISRAAEKKDLGTVKSEIERGLMILMFLVMPCIVALTFFSHDVVSIIFGHRGHFSSEDISLTTHALWVYALGLYFYTAVQILSRAFYAMKNTKDPVKYSIISILLNTLFCALLVHSLKIQGIALATALASLINFSQLYYFYNKKYIKLAGMKLLLFCILIIATCAISGGVTMLLTHTAILHLITFSILYLLILTFIGLMICKGSIKKLIHLIHL